MKGAEMKPAPKLYTLPGVLLEEAIKELDRLLPVEAYKPMKAANGEELVLTNINPHFAMDLISELFGILGLGWGYEILGRKPEGHYVSVQIKCWYKLNDEAGNPVNPVEWTAFGGNSNSGNREWAEKGALTNAISAAWSMQGLQASVYKGLRSHLTVDKEWRDRKGLSSESEKETTQVEKPEPQIAPEESKPEPAAPVGQKTPEKEPASQQRAVSPDATPPKEPAPQQRADQRQQQPSITPIEEMKGKMKAANMEVSQSKDGETIYAKCKEKSNPAGVSMARKLGGKWDSKLKPEVHGLKGDGAWVIPVHPK